MSYVDGIEVDVRLSKDGIPFLYQAKTLEEATNGYGKPEDYKWEQLKQLSYKSNNQKLLVLTDLFNLVGSQKFIFLDIKSDKIFDHELCSKITELINKYHSQAGEEEIQTQLDQIPFRRIIRPDMPGIRFNTPLKLIKPLIDHGYPIMIWTVDDKQIAEDFFNLGVKSIQTNKPLDLIKTQESRPFIIYDAGGTISKPSLIIHAKNIYDIIEAIKKAKLNNKKITIAGRKHLWVAIYFK